MSNSSNAFQEIVHRERGLHRNLSARQMSMIAIGGAVGTGLFLGSGFAIGFAGPAVLISYAVGALIALLLMGCLAEMTVAHPTPGSFGAYAEFYIHPWAGFVVRYAYWACYVLAVGTEVTAVALYMQYWFPQSPAWVWIVSFSSVLIAINALSVDIFGMVEYWFSAIKIAAIAGFILLGAYVVYGAPVDSPIGFKNYFVDGGFFPQGAWGVWVAVIVSIFSYLGIEMIAVAAGEAREPETSVVAAFRATMIRLALFYMLTLSLILAIVPWTSAGTGKSPFVTVMEAIHIIGGPSVINFVVLIAALSAMNSQLYITTRMMFSLSRAGHASPALGKLSRRGVPMRALALSCLGIALAVGLSILYPDGSLAMMMALAMFGAMFTWMMIFITHLCFRHRRASQPNEPQVFRMWGGPLPACVGAALMMAIMLTTWFTVEFKATLLFGLPFLLLLSLLYFIFYRKPAQQ